MDIMQRDINRRDLMKGAAAAAAVASGAAIAQQAYAGEGSPSSKNENGSSSSVVIGSGYANPDGIGTPVTPDAKESADVVVLGSGMGGFTASMLVKEQAPDSVVVMLEKSDTLGGNTNFAEGGGGFVSMSPEDARASVQADVVQRNFVVDPELFYALRTNQGACSDWLFGKHGVQIKDYGTGQPLYLDGHGSTLEPQAEELGVDIRTGSRAFALVLDDPYTVTGVQYRDASGKVTQIDAKAVVVATGGMNTNPDLLRYYCNVDLSKIMPLGTGQDGDGHLMVEQTAHGRTGLQTIDGFFSGIGVADDPCGFTSDLNTAAGFQFSDVFVNQYGRRFYDESMGFNTGSQLFFTCIPQMILSQRAAFSVFDASYVARWEQGEWQNGKCGYDSATKKGQPLAISDDLQAVMDKDWFYHADTIEGLGRLIAADFADFDVEAFVATIDAYNAAAAGDQPDERGKPQEYCWELKTPPFYAARSGVNAYNTNGGIHINTKAQVVDPDGTPITGLYASGIATAGWDSQVYGGGTNQPVALFCSCMAALDIVRNVLGGTVDDDWMGDVTMTDILGDDYVNGNPLG
jgi:fumarate reductase flavoprotein subunit